MFFVSLQSKQLSNTKLLKSHPSQKRVALIEFASSHDECLLTQIISLKDSNCWVRLVTNQTIRDRNENLENLVDEWVDIDPRGVGILGAAIGDALIIRRLMRSLKRDKIELVIFNTAQGGHVRNACLFSLFHKIEFAGIVHTIRKFNGSFTQKIIHLKIINYFVLAEFLKEQIPPQNKLQIEAFYPLAFPKNDGEISEENPTEKDTVLFALIGGVELRRKDLIGFVSIVQQCGENVRFAFLGKADPEHPDVIELKKNLTEINCLNRVDFFDKNLNSDTMNRILRNSNAILPLIHPNTPSCNEYFRNQIPGAMNIALGHNIPLLLHESFERIAELNSASVYYRLEDFSIAFDELKSLHDSLRKAMRLNENYSVEFQRKKYAEFLFS